MTAFSQWTQLLTSGLPVHQSGGRGPWLVLYLATTQALHTQDMPIELYTEGHGGNSFKNQPTYLCYLEEQYQLEILVILAIHTLKHFRFLVQSLGVTVFKFKSCSVGYRTLKKKKHFKDRGLFKVWILYALGIVVYTCRWFSKSVPLKRMASSQYFFIWFRSVLICQRGLIPCRTKSCGVPDTTEQDPAGYQTWQNNDRDVYIL